MILRVPSYYKEFRCIADRCSDSCCIGWEIDIDEDTFSYYKSVEGSFGERLRAHMVTDECNSFRLEENGWCPFLNRNKLCEICMELGEAALSEVCTEFPRFTMEYENVREKVLSLSCEEVGRLVFSSEEKITWEEHELPEDCMEYEADGSCGEYDLCGEADACGEVEAAPDAERLKAVREHAVAILQDRTRPIFSRAAEYLDYCARMQSELYGGSTSCDTDGSSCGTDPALCTADETAYHDFLARMERFGQLEVLDETWTREKEALLAVFHKENYLSSQRAFAAAQKDRAYEYEHLLVYFTFRYFMRAYYDDNILAKAQLAVTSVLMIRDMDVLRYVQSGGAFSLSDRIDTARIYSKEVEHSEENMEALAEDFQFEEVFRTESLKRQLIVGKTPK